MRNRLLKSIFISLILLMGVSNAWAVDFTGGKIYFRNDVTNWTTSNIQIFAHQSGYTWVSGAMSKVADTKLYYINASCNWGGFVSYRICGNSSAWGSGSFTNQSSSTKYTGNNSSYGLNGGSIYLITPANANNGCSISPQYYGSNNDFLKYKATVKVKTSTNGSDYTTTTSGNWPATITIKGTYLSGDGKTTRSDVTTSKGASSSYDAVATGLITMTYSSLNSEYAFAGWGTGNVPSSTSESYEYNIGKETTVYAFFKKKYTVTFDDNGHGTAPSSQTIIAGAKATMPTAPAEAGYTFGGWYKDANCTSAFDFNTAITENVTLYAKWTLNATYSLEVVEGTGIESVTGSTDPVTLGNRYHITATPKAGYRFETWTANPTANAKFDNDNAELADTYVTVLNGSVIVTASATEVMSALTTSYTYNEGTLSIDAPTTNASEIGIATTATINAATNIDYTLASWTLENCVRTDDGAENATTITVKSNGDGAAATVTANYNLIPKITLYFVNSTQWEVVACHHWKEGVSGTTWPGDPMEVVGTVHGFDIYKVKFTELEHNLCIFNNDDKGKQTGNLAVQDGKYYYPETDEWYATVAELPTPCTDCSDYAIAGSMNDWSARRNRLKVTANNDIVELTLELTAGDYEFKVAGPEGWFGNSGKYERKDSGNAWTFRRKDDENNDEKNASIYIDMTGEYTFTWQISTKKLTITYPELPDFSQQTDIILFRPSTNWKKDDARFAAYFFGATAEKWVDMTDADGDGIYEAANPKTNLSVKICCLKSGKTETKWENVKWRSINYEIPTGVENCWVVNDEAEDDATGIWTVLIGKGDNSTTLSAANSQTANTLVNRQFTTGNLYTISLPFALDAEQVETIFGAGTTLYQFAQLVKENEELVLYFSTPSAIAAATPYLIEPTQDVINGFIVEDATISTTPNNISFTVDATTITMKPILSATAGEKTNGTTEYWLAADRYLYNNKNTLLSLRALFNISTVSGMPPRCRVALGENAETGIDNIINGENTTIKMIENDQLIIIRNGVKYNVQGMRL